MTEPLTLTPANRRALPADGEIVQMPAVFDPLSAPIGEVASGVWPFIIMMLATVFAIYFLPDIAMYIPLKL